MEKKDLQKYAHKLMFDMTDEEYDILNQEFTILFKQIDKINNIKDIEKIEPMTLPFTIEYTLREDQEEEILTTKDALKNARKVIDDQVCVPKVVE